GELKETLMRRGSYEHYLLDQIASEANRDKKIECSVYLCRKNDDNYIKIVVEDMGEGFDRLSIFRKLMEPATVRFHQRGLIMIQQMVDGLYFNFRGNKTFIIKKIGKENK
ncbi:MAG: ATP-binding protein, partial [Campylobacterales bacterium]